MGFTGLALGAMLFRDGVARADEEAWQPPDGRPHFAPRAKSVIWIFLCGGVSHLESFDVKPALNTIRGQVDRRDAVQGRARGLRAKTSSAANPTHGNRKTIMPLQTGYQAYGQSGLVVGDWFQNIGACADDLAVVRSLWTIHNDHGAQLTWQTGRHPRELNHPTIGSWICYGLGTLNQNLPEYVVLGDADGRLLRRRVHARRGVSRAGVCRRAARTSIRRSRFRSSARPTRASRGGATARTSACSEN